MFEILKIGFKLLVNDRTKFFALLVGITFAVSLMIEMTSLFSGIMSRALATVINTGAKIWVMDPAVQTVASPVRWRRSIDSRRGRRICVAARRVWHLYAKLPATRDDGDGAGLPGSSLLCG